MPDHPPIPAWDRGYVQVYTGDGKGKTTAAVGLAVRAAEAGVRVLFAQFMKARKTGEIAALARWGDRVTVRRFGLEPFTRGKPGEADVKAAREGLAVCREELESGQYGLVILDEANIAVHFGLFDVEALLAVVAAKPPQVELVLTGRRAPKEILARADLVTEMRCVKHYYEQGVPARRGIEM